MKDENLITLIWKTKNLMSLIRLVHAEIELLSTRIEEHQCLWEQENAPR